MKSYFFRRLPFNFSLLCAKTKFVGSDLHDPYILLVRLDRTYGIWDLELGRCCVEMHHGTCFRDAITFIVGYHEIALETGGAFHSSKTPGLNFRQLPGANGTAFSKNSKTGQPREVYPIFEFFFPEVFSPVNFAPGNLEFSVEWLPIRKFKSFRNFWKLFREISVRFAAVSKFWKVLVELKAPWV